MHVMVFTFGQESTDSNRMQKKTARGSLCKGFIWFVNDAENAVLIALEPHHWDKTIHFPTKQSYIDKIITATTSYFISFIFFHDFESHLVVHLSIMTSR